MIADSQVTFHLHWYSAFHIFDLTNNFPSRGFRYEVNSKLVSLEKGLTLSEPLKCDTKDFKHDRFDGEAFDLEVKKREGIVDRCF